jgi:UDP-N-acetylglucosamine:LPS N-acetylglucosamine transferase
MHTPTPALLFAGGGSGGHIYPGLAILGELRTLAPAPVHAVFLVSDRAIDAQIMTKAGEPFAASPARPVIVRPAGLLRFVRAWGPAVRHARGQIRALRAAHGAVRVVATGGFVAAPAVRAAALEGVPVTMVNLDAVPGKANRWIAARVARMGPESRVFTAARVADAALARGWTEVPPIVRAGSRPSGDRAACRAGLGLDPSRPVLMITGGSQGVRTINAFVRAWATGPGRDALRTGGWQVLHQTGRDEDVAIARAYQAAGLNARVQAFVDTMGLWWGAADLCVCTAGAGNVAEVWTSRTPALLMPYPYHKDQHQKFNALSLEACGGVVVATDHIDESVNLERVGPVLASLIADRGRLDAMARGLDTLGPADGALRIARTLLDPASSS